MSIKNVEDIEMGDKVAGWDPTGGRMVTGQVTRLYRRKGAPVVDVFCITDSGFVQKIRATPQHPFWVEEKGWTAASELSIGDALKSMGGEPSVRVVWVSRVDHTVDVYNFEVAEVHNYFVGRQGVLVHNVSSGARESSPPEAGLVPPRDPTNSATFAGREGRVYDSVAEHAAKVGGVYTVGVMGSASGIQVVDIAVRLEEKRALGKIADYRVFAADSQRANIDRASAGGYSKAELQGLSGMRQLQLRKEGDLWKLNPEVRRRIDYSVQNVLDPRLPDVWLGPRADAVVMTNLLMHLDEPQQRLAVDNLLGVMKPGALFGIGHGDPRGAIPSNFKPISDALPWVYVFPGNGGGSVPMLATRPFIQATRQPPIPAFAPSPGLAGPDPWANAIAMLRPGALPRTRQPAPPR